MSAVDTLTISGTRFERTLLAPDVALATARSSAWNSSRTLPGQA